MDPYTAEAQQVEDIKKWWREHGLSVVLGLTLCISGIFGWRYWQDAQAQRARAASALYSDMIAALQNDNDAGAREFAEQILGQYENTSYYGVFALMTLARLAVAAEDLETAGTHLHRALKQSKDDSLSHVIRLRLVRILISRGETGPASALLEQDDQGAFASAYNELLGDISVMQGDLEAARRAYQRALDKARSAGRDRTTVELKLDNIGQPGA